MISNQPDIRSLITSVRRCVAIAKVAEFEHQAFRLGDYVSNGIISASFAADTLQEVAFSNDLVRAHGDEFIQAIIADGLNNGGRD